MANIPSQEKRIHRAERERMENRRRTSQVKTWFRRLEDAMRDGDAERAAAEHRSLTSRIDKAVKSGALHRNNGARKKARAERIRSQAS
jgi:small subunit ribosomal protein S20